MGSAPAARQVPALRDGKVYQAPAATWLMLMARPSPNRLQSRRLVGIFTVKVDNQIET